MKKIKLIIIALIANLGVFAQVSVTARMDTSMLLIGDQTQFTLEANVPKNSTVTFPLFADTIINKLEVVETQTPDTLTENDMWKIRHSYTVTSFDSGWYEIPPLLFAVLPNGDSSQADTLLSKPVYFGVMTMPLDTINTNAIADIKKQADAPLTFREVMPFVLVVIGVLLLALIGYFIYKRFIKKEKIFIKKEKPKEPAHVIAFRDLDLLKEKKLWEQGRDKDFYSELTDIVRTYLENRYGIFAMEMTTDEIHNQLIHNKEMDKELTNELYSVLLNADFVKFAKATTVDSENKAAFKFAYEFVIKTKEQEQTETEQVEEEEHV